MARRYKRLRKGRRVPFSPAIDRRVDAVNKPYRAELVERRVDDPYDQGRQIVVSATLRDDPLGWLHSRRYINDAQRAAGQWLQARFELLGVSTLRAMDFTKTPVDGGGFNIVPLTDAQKDAGSAIIAAQRALGPNGFQLVREVLAAGKTIATIAKERGYTKRPDILYLGQRFRECLETLAHQFGFIATGSEPRKVRDKHSLNARFAHSPQLHRAVRAAKETTPCA